MDVVFLAPPPSTISPSSIKIAAKCDPEINLRGMKLVKDGFVDLTKLISRTYPIADAGAAFQDMDQHSAEIVKAEFDFRRE